MAQTAANTNNETARRVPLSMSYIGIYVSPTRTQDGGLLYPRVSGFTVTDRGKVRGMDIGLHELGRQRPSSGDPRRRDGQKNSLTITSTRFHSASPRSKTCKPCGGAWKSEPGVSDLRGMDHGNAWSLYFRDPEGNRLEIFCDTQWYIEQPCIEDLDLSLPADQIRAKSDAFCRTAPGFKPIAEYQAEVAKKIAEN